LSRLFSGTPLAFELICKHATLTTMGDVVGMFSELTPEERLTYWWSTAIHMVNNAIKEPRYIKAATFTLQTALNLNGMLAQPPEANQTTIMVCTLSERHHPEAHAKNGS
jgi:hypothetical protein